MGEVYLGLFEAYSANVREPAVSQYIEKHKDSEEVLPKEKKNRTRLRVLFGSREKGKATEERAKIDETIAPRLPSCPLCSGRWDGMKDIDDLELFYQNFGKRYEVVLIADLGMLDGFTKEIITGPKRTKAEEEMRQAVRKYGKWGKYLVLTRRFFQEHTK